MSQIKLSEGSLISLYICVISLFLGVACDDGIQTSLSPELSVTPRSLIFPSPSQGQITSTVSLEVSNPGQGDLLISDLELIEDDEREEIAILDRADWTQGNVVIAAGVSRELRLQWNVLDAQPDRARLTLSSNAGSKTVEIQTPDLDPSLKVSTVPGGDLPIMGGLIELNDLTAGEERPIRVTLYSDGVVPLSLERVCFVGSDEVCTDEQEGGRGSFRLCDGLDPSRDCPPPNLPEETLLSGESYTFSILYHLERDSFDSVASRVLISSDSGENPRYVIRLVGTPCHRINTGDVCGDCGDGIVDDGEECDDGNLSEDDHCFNNCVAAFCGDGHIAQSSEECDDGDDDPSDECLNDCTLARCGDGVIRTDLAEGETGYEFCDDGNEDQTDACVNGCQIARCGDGFIQAGVEECDDMNQVNNDGCTNECQVVQCGDGVVHEGAEGCDDGNLIIGDGCDARCVIEECGNGVLQIGEDCDDGGESEHCDLDCTIVECGDRVINSTAGEECDDGGESSTCDLDCTIVECGDGVLNSSAGESCDDGGESATCDVDCTLAECGDGVTNSLANEDCDDGGESITCDVDCTHVECGDGVINTSIREDCDDGGESATCDADCTIAECGDGVTNSLANEDCDDGGESVMCDDDCTVVECGDGNYNESAGELCDGGENMGECVIAEKTPNPQAVCTPSYPQMIPYHEFSLGVRASCGADEYTSGFGYSSTFTEVGFQIDVSSSYQAGDVMTLGFTGWASGSSGLVAIEIEVSNDNQSWAYVGSIPAREYLGNSTRDEIDLVLPNGGDSLYVRLTSDIFSHALLFVRTFDAEVVGSCP